MKFQIKNIKYNSYIYYFYNTTALKIAANKKHNDIFLYLLGLPNIEIRDYCFSDCKNITQISIPSSVTLIGNYAFLNCTNLIQISIPPTVESIGQHAFHGCEQISEINIPSSIKSIGEKSFKDCKSLKTIQIPSSVENIDKYAFNNCISLKEMIIPTSVKSIGDCFISGCTSLEKVIIPDSVTKIGRLDFQNFENLTNVILPSSTNIINEYAFSKCTSLTTIEIPPSVVNINQFAFHKCLSLKKITIPNLVMTIKNNTFDGCSSLEQINIPSKITSIESNAFKDCTSLVNITIPSSVKTIGFNAFKGCKILEKIIYENVQSNLEITFKSLRAKIIILGPSNVGKTCIIDRYVNGKIEDNYEITITPDHKEKIIDILGNNVELQLWDTTGNERFQAINQIFYRDADGVVAVFDLCNKESVGDIKTILNKFFESNKADCVLIGNKSDLNHEVTIEDIQPLEEEFRTKCFEVSAVDNSNINEAFEYLINKVIKEDIEEKNRLEKLIIYNGNNCSIF